MGLNFSLIEKHPYATGGGIIVAGLLIYALFLRGGSGGGSASSDGTTPQERLAAMGYADQAAARNTQLAIANLSINGQQGLATIQGSFSLHALEDQLAAQTSQQAANNAASLQALSIQEAVALQQLQSNAATQQLQITSAQQISQAQIAASLQQTQAVTQAAVVTAHENALLQEHLADTNAAVAINQANQWANVQIIMSNNARRASTSSSNASMWGSIIGAVAMAFI